MKQVVKAYEISTDHTLINNGEDRAIKIIREYLEQLFPKNCATCGYQFNTYKEYLHNTTHIGTPHSYDAARGIWQSSTSIGTISMANCRCGNTLALSSAGMDLMTMWKLLRWARGEASRKKLHLDDYLKEIREKIKSQVLSE